MNLEILENVENTNFERGVIKVNGEWTNDPDLFMEAMDQGISEVHEDDYGIYE